MRNNSKILVVGDWFVDEHWVTGVHRSPTSSRTGKSHHRALHLPSSTTESFCGAGLSASILYCAKDENGEKFFDIKGIGLWHKDDTDALISMLDPVRARAQTPHRLTREKVDVHQNILFNLGKIIEARTQVNNNRDEDENYGTSRIMRIYQRTGEKTELIQRIDWEVEIPSDKGWIKATDKKFLKTSGLKDFLEDSGFIGVIIKDMYKGIINEFLVRWLADQPSLKKIPWFVSSKAWNPDWLKFIPPDNFKLLLIPQIAAKEAMQRNKFSSWITITGQASQSALNAIDEIAKKVGNQTLIIALPDGSSIIAKERGDNRNKGKGYLQTDPDLPKLTIGMPMASVFFPVVVAHLLGGPKLDVLHLLKKGLSYTVKWMKEENRRIENPEKWTPSKEPLLHFSKRIKEPEIVGEWLEEPLEWEKAKEDWKNALSSQGIITCDDPQTGNGNRIELKRSMTEVDGYVCTVKSKREILQQLVHDLELFKSSSGKKPVNCMLIASPGSGKTFLVRRLAEAVKMRPLMFNITQMLSKTDILDCFDTIVTTQAQNKEEPLLVFFDEINATLMNEQVYDIFLAPLEEGFYVRAGKTFHIDPCAWIFAGTEPPYNEKDPKRKRSDKASDFVSRLTMEPLKFKSKFNKKRVNEEAQIEKVYLGVTLLHTVFPDVQSISKKVLILFQNLHPNLEARKIERFIKSFTNIQYGKVISKNVPDEWINKDNMIPSFSLSSWKNEKETDNDLVKIIG